MSSTRISFGRALVLTATMAISCPVATCSVYASSLDAATTQGVSILAGLISTAQAPDYATALYVEPQRECWNETQLVGYSKSGKALHRTFLICE